LQITRASQRVELVLVAVSDATYVFPISQRDQRLENGPRPSRNAAANCCLLQIRSPPERYCVDTVLSTSPRQTMASEEFMNKIITAAAFSLALASSAFAQTATPGPEGTVIPKASESTNSGSMSTDTTTTQSTTSGANTGTSGSSAAGTSEACPAGTPGAGTAGKTPADATKLNPNCP
jgi:hypothetical protein